MEHHPTFVQWVQHHGWEITMVWFPAFLGYLNATVASLKVMGFSKAAELLGKLEDGLKTFVDTLKTQGGINAQKNSANPGAGPVAPGGTSADPNTQPAKPNAG